MKIAKRVPASLQEIPVLEPNRGNGDIFRRLEYSDTSGAFVSRQFFTSAVFKGPVAQKRLRLRLLEIQTRFAGGISYPLDLGERHGLPFLTSTVPPGYYLWQVLEEARPLDEATFFHLARLIVKTAGEIQQRHGIWVEMDPNSILLSGVESVEWQVTFSTVQWEREFDFVQATPFTQDLSRVLYFLGTGDFHPFFNPLLKKGPREKITELAQPKIREFLLSLFAPQESDRPQLVSELETRIQSYERGIDQKPNLRLSPAKRAFRHWLPRFWDVDPEFRAWEPLEDDTRPCTFRVRQASVLRHFLPPERVTQSEIAGLDVARKLASPEFSSKILAPVTKVHQTDDYTVIEEPEITSAVTFSELLRAKTPVSVNTAFNLLGAISDAYREAEEEGYDLRFPAPNDVLLVRRDQRGARPILSERPATWLVSTFSFEVKLRAFRSNPFFSELPDLKKLARGEDSGVLPTWRDSLFRPGFEFVNLVALLLLKSQPDLPPSALTCLLRTYHNAPLANHQERKLFLEQLRQTLQPRETARWVESGAEFERPKVLFEQIGYAAAAVVVLLAVLGAWFLTRKPETVAANPPAIVEVASRSANSEPLGLLTDPARSHAKPQATSSKIASPQFLPENLTRPIPVRPPEPEVSANSPGLAPPVGDSFQWQNHEWRLRVEEARNFREVGDFASAAQHLAPLSEAASESAGVREELEAWAEAISLAGKSIDLGAGSPAGDLARVLAEEFEFSGALTALSEWAHWNDSPESPEWNRRAAEAGDIGAMTTYGVYLSHGMGLPQNLSEAFYWFQRAAELGSVDSRYFLAECYIFGKGTSPDIDLGIQHLRQAYEAGDDKAANMLGTCYSKGIGVPQDFKKARKLYQESIERGSDVAYGNLGVAYLRGRGGPVDKGLAAEHFRLGAEREDPVAAYFYAKCLEQGIGTVANAETAESWYLTAANFGHPGALDWCDERGLVVAGDRGEADELDD